MSAPAITSLFARGGGAAYAKFRPTYPLALVERVVKHCVGMSDTVAVDVGCGTGQLTTQLAEHVTRAVGIDVSADQVDAAAARPNVRYEVGSAHQLPCDADSADLITIAQTMHWLDPVLTFAECRRVLKPGGLLAVIGYPLCEISSSSTANDALRVYHFETLKPFWHPNRWLLDDGYTFFDLSEHGFEACETLQFSDEREMQVDEFIGFMSTGSARQTCIEQTASDPLVGLRREIAEAIGSATNLTVRFPFFVKLGVRPTNAH